MREQFLKELRQKTFFGVEDITEIFGIKLNSAKVLCNRYVKKGIFLRIKKNLYVLKQNWELYSKEEFFKIANVLQIPSYVSLLTALSEYGVTTQIPRNYYESISLKRSAKFSVMGTEFNFYKVKRNYYFGFEKINGIFIASKEKALVDAIYLYSFGKYKIDFSALNIDILDRDKIGETLKVFPPKTQNIVKRICRI
jgi:predicted transcriptional regulator of viral defense system